MSAPGGTDAPDGTDGAAAPLLGVAVRVPEPWSTLLQRERAATGDPVAWSVAPHVTLVNPTPVAPAARAAVSAHLERVAAAADPFVLRLRGTGTFRPVSPVVYVDVVAGHEACAALERAARRGPLAQPLRFPFHPHVTVAHHVDDDAADAVQARLADLEAEFLVEALECFVQGPDGVWRTEDVHRLGGGSPAPVAAASRADAPGTPRP
ncbi:2'-5' RNA ligase family protein [Cellulomonas endophytica]|uniref:2'-5' RNA ligase family protein n=1 Tax=Cellulomonas endophytica TaxID=2494735 RepID=UPI001F0BFB6C|nr:2'-5' RNA ligase family protein [Cellulomonas endophytica]